MATFNTKNIPPGTLVVDPNFFVEPVIPLRVNPGDIITAAFMNSLVQRVSGLENQFAANIVTVPNVIGRTLLVAAQTVNGVGLRVGTVIDVGGKQVQITDPGAAKRVVVSTEPAPGDRVALNRDVAILLTEKTAVKDGPDIASLAPPLVTIGAPLTILGSHFQNAEVLFDDVKITDAVLVDEGATIHIASVPSFRRGLGGGVFVPANTAELAQNELAAAARASTNLGIGISFPPVTVTVRNADGSSSDTIQAPFGGFSAARPFISDIKLTKARDDFRFTILGGNFGTDAFAAPKVFFDGKAAESVDRLSPTTLDVHRIPDAVTLDLMKISESGWAKLVQLDSDGQLPPQSHPSNLAGDKLAKVLIEPAPATGTTKEESSKTAKTAIAQKVVETPLTKDFPVRGFNEENFRVLHLVDGVFLPDDTIETNEVSVVVKIGSQMVSEPFLMVIGKQK